MRKELKKPALILILITVFSISALAQPMQAKGPRGNDRMNIVEKLNLSEAQQKQMKDLRFDLESKMIDLKADLQSERLKLKQLLSADEPNKKKIFGQVEKIGVAEVNIEKARIDHKLSVRNILTDDQLKIFRQGMLMRGDRFGDDRGGKDKMKCDPPRHHRP